MPTAIESLSRCSLFRDFTETGLQIIASISSERVVPSGTPLFVESMVGDAFYLVKRGKVRVAMRGPDGREQQLAVLGEGEYLGELSLLSASSIRLVSAVADGECEVLEIRQRDFARLQTQKPQACLKLILAIANSFGKKMGDNRDALRGLLTSAARR